MPPALFVCACDTLSLRWRPDGIRRMLSLAVFITIGLLALIPAYARDAAQGRRSIHTTPAATIGIVHTGILPSIFGNISYNRAIGVVGTN